MTIPMLFVSRDPETGTQFGITSGPVDPQRLELVSGGEFGPVLQQHAPGRRRSDIAFEDFSFHWVNDAIAAAFEPCADEEVSFDADLTDGESLVIDFGGRNYHPDSWEFARFVVHEAFHYHQLFQANWKVPIGYDPATPPSTDPENARLAQAESKLIELAALANDDASALNFAREFISRRRERYRRWPEVEMLERGTEQVEGSARYVENQYSRINGRASRLNMPPEALRHDQDWIDFGRLYRSGARMLELLDRFDSPWRKRLTQGSDPFWLLCELLAD